MGRAKNPKSLRNPGLDMSYSRMNVAKWYRRGVPVAEIAQELKISEATVRNDIKKIKEMWNESAKEEYGWRVGEMLEDIREMRRELWEAWFLSKEDCIKTILSFYMDKDEDGEDVKKLGSKRQVRETKLPDVKYMNSLRDLLSFEADLLGIKKVNENDGKALLKDLIELYANKPRELSPVQQQLNEARQQLMDQHGISDQDVLDVDYEVIRDAFDGNESSSSADARGSD